MSSEKKAIKYSTIATLKNPRYQYILDCCIEAFDLEPCRVIPVEQLVEYCNLLRGLSTNRDEVWKVLWCISNLHIRYIPKIDAFRWNGATLRNKAWFWELRKE